MSGKIPAFSNGPCRLTPTYSESSPNENATSILRLNNDVLSYIFEMNADMFSSHFALYDARNTSQVCKEWRNIILNSPAMWGRLLDFNSRLRWSSVKWINEVLYRSGSSSPLWIRVKSYTAKETLPSFFFSVLEAHWSRIEKLVVGISQSDLKRWQSIYTPAPGLRVFEVQIHDIDTVDVEQPSLNTLFDHNAPLLHTFHAINFKFGPQAPWLAGIRSLHVGSPFTFAELVNVLAMMLLLENLHVDSLSVMEPGTVANVHPAPICLQNLNSVAICLDIIEANTLLACITPRQGFSLDIRAFSSRQVSTTENLSKSFQTLSKCSQDFYDVHTPSVVTIRIYRLAPPLFAFVFRMRENSENESSLQFSVDVRFRRGEALLMLTVTTILNAVVMPAFKGATELKLELESVQFPAMDLNLGTVLVSFHVIHTLSTNERMLGHFLKLQEQETNIFLPRLQVVNVRIDSILDVTYFENDKGDLLRFLRSRRDAGHPIRILNLMDCDADISPFLEYFEEMKGMKILWTTWPTDISGSTLVT